MQVHRPLLILTLLAVLATTACGSKIDPGTTDAKDRPTVKAPVAAAQVTQQPFIYEAVGTVTAHTASTLSSKLMGTVRAVHVREGDAVKKGDLLVTIDQRQVAAQLDKARASLKEARRAEASARSARDAAQANARLAANTYQRYVQLLADNSASQQEFDEVEARYRQAQASLAQTEAMLEAAHQRIQQAQAAVTGAAVSKKDAAIRAPYNGRVTAKMIDVGDLASPGTPFLTIEEEGRYRTDLVLPERHIQAVRIGQQVTVKIPALNNLTATGTIDRIFPTADARSRSFQVKVKMPAGLDLNSGMFARVAIPVGGTGLLLIPNTAIVHHGQLTGLFQVDDQQIAHFRLVRTGRSYGEKVEILSGLKQGQRYVIAAPITMVNGSRVEAN